MLRAAYRQVLQRSTEFRSYGSDSSASRMLLADKVAIITGASSGIGAATAKVFSQNGARVILADIHDERGKNVSEELGQDYVHCDVSVEKEVEATVELAMSKYGKLDVMFNNAGICNTSTKLSSLCSIAEIQLSDFEEVCGVNLRGAFLGVKHASRVMIPRKSGCILSTASVTAIQAQRSCHSYTITKHGVIGITRTAASELSKYGIRVNCISPTVVSTRLATETLEEVMSLKKTSLEKLLLQNSELAGSKIDVFDIADAALFLASSQSRFISGHNLVVDGGFTIAKPFNPFVNPHAI